MKRPTWHAIRPEWRGKEDEEAVASAMDFKDNIDRVWLTFSVGQEPTRVLKFREDLMPLIEKKWPTTLSLPIMPNGAIPLEDDLVLTPTGYIVRSSSTAKYR